ncbi:2-phosphosulfolactate phosphatase [Salipaludibacillus sp. CUR1]|uniref:2-phosphosulfolactate phosphatase n=1 Tax=Salipaludibacillus sp. CUR1 TaxID=2820003 RepID=UPI001E572B10|nr:2-phosphosulfolactate phosphatase [Salipaludibacillus sp. CUR1]MCE7791319.1 2-phosphosulfolactate phosphatase [Salipaludibacillus sp. CUR1]
MTKVHLLFKKEEINEEKIDGKIAVVFDVLLATSTITAALTDGVKEVVPVLNREEAESESLGRQEGTFLIAGEHEGKAIENFHEPNPVKLKKLVAGKTMILSTTNGTVAVRKASTAKKVYISSLLNGKAAAEEIVTNHADETVVLICSGSSGEFCIEDFYGAGYFIDCLMKKEESFPELTDAAYAAYLFYERQKDESEKVLLQSRVGQMLAASGYGEEVRFVADCGALTVVPYLHGKKIIV